MNVEMQISSANLGFENKHRQALLQVVMLEWLPRRVCEDIKAVHYESNFEHACEMLRVEFKNGGMSPYLKVEHTSRVMVERLKVLESDKDFDYWRSYCCMIAGPEQG